MKILPESKSKRLIYLVGAILFAALFYIGSLFQCVSTSIPQFILIFIATLLFVVLAWNDSLVRNIPPSNLMSISKIFINSIWSFIYLAAFSLLLIIPIAIFTPHYTCYNDRAANGEVLSLLSGTRMAVAELIEENGSVENDYSNITKPHHGRLEYFEINGFGRILVHANNPEFTVFLTPSYKEGSVKWQCKAFPAIQSPAMCR